MLELKVTGLETSALSNKDQNCSGFVPNKKKGSLPLWRARHYFCTVLSMQNRPQTFWMQKSMNMLKIGMAGLQQDRDRGTTAPKEGLGSIRRFTLNRKS